MSLQHRTLWMRVGVSLFILGLSGCVTPPVPRMSSVLELPVVTSTHVSRQLNDWSGTQTMGMATFSDATGHDTAPPISPEFLSRLTLRAKAHVEEQCSVPNVEILSSSGLDNPSVGSALVQQAKRSRLDSLLVILFSSTEVSQPAMFGESRMMTQMPGTTTHNQALVELALVDVVNGMILQQVTGIATERMDRLQVPLGEDQLTLDEALDILRANAGQQALDDALPKLTGCRSI